MIEPILSEYTDYRAYLSDFYKYKREQTKDCLRPYRYSDFSTVADIKSPNYLKLIIEAQRNLSKTMIRKFSRALKHSGDQTTEFELLVLYCQEKDPMQRSRNLKELSEFRAKKLLKTGQLDRQCWDRTSNWLVWILHAMVDQKDVNFHPENLKELLRGQVNKAQITQALNKLLETGSIELDPENQKAKKVAKVLSGIQSIPTQLVRKIQSELICLALESIYKCPPNEREISGFTLAMTKKEYEWVRFELRKLRKQIQKQISMNRESSLGDRVYQMNIQLFPLTDPTQEKNRNSGVHPQDPKQIDPT